MDAGQDQVILPKAEFIDDVAKYMEGKSVDTVLATLNEHRRKFTMVENQLMQRKARLMTKLPEIQKALDIVDAFIKKQGQEMVLDYELAEGVYAKTRVSDVQTVNLWLGANVMVEYSLKDAQVGCCCVQELLSTNLSNAKANIATVEVDLDVIKDNVATIDVSIARVWNYGVELRKKGQP